jgi:hypothetical protein
LQNRALRGSLLAKAWNCYWLSLLRLVVESISQLAFRAISRGADVSRALIGARFEIERGKQRKLKTSSADKTPARMRAPRDCKNVEVNGSDAMPRRRYVPGG